MSVNKEQKLTFFRPDFESELRIPYINEGVSAGFPSPAADFMETNIDLNKELSENPLATFYIKVKGNSMIDAGINVNMENQAGLVRDGGILEYSRIHDMTIQAWSPFQYGFFEGVFVGNTEKFPELNARLQELADQYKVTPSGIAAAFINRHPAKMQTILGTMTPSRIIEATEAADIVLTREEWYSLYMAAGNILP